MGSKMGAGPSITSNISVSNLMRRCEWILKQAGEAPGVACAGPPGPAAGLNKYAAEQTCRQLGPDMAAAVCVVALRRTLRRKQRDSSVFPGRRGGEKPSWGAWSCAVSCCVCGQLMYWWFMCVAAVNSPFTPGSLLMRQVIWCSYWSVHAGDSFSTSLVDLLHQRKTRGNLSRGWKHLNVHASLSRWTVALVCSLRG